MNKLDKKTIDEFPLVILQALFAVDVKFKEF